MHKLRDFLESGTLTPLAIGQSPHEVRQALGKPSEAGGTAKQRIWKYGSMQLAFQRDPALRTEAICFIGLYFHHGDLELPEAIRAEAGFPSHGATMEDVVRYLEEQDIRYSPDKQLTFDARSPLATPSGAHIIFNCSEGEVILDSIQLLREPKSCLK